MRKLVLCGLLMMALPSCGKSCPGPVAPQPITKCKVAKAAPAPSLASLPSLNAADLIALAKWIHNFADVERDIERCSLVERVE